MNSLTIDLDDDADRLVREAARAVNQPLGVWARDSLCRAAARAVEPAAPARRVSPLHPGAMQPSADFNAPMEEFAPYC